MLPKAYQNQVDAIIDGRQEPYTGRAASAPGAGRAVMAAVAEKDPGYDASLYPARKGLRESFTNGADANTIVSRNTALGHLNELDATINKLPTVGWAKGTPFASYYMTLANAAAQKGTGSPEAQALASFDSARRLYSDEITKFYAGTGGGEAEREQAQRDFDEAKTPAELHAAVATQARLIQSKTAALQYKWHQGMDSPTRKAADFPIDTPTSQKALDEIAARSPQGGAGALTQSQAISQAKDAIARGADPTAVRQRLIQGGFDATGL
jgi:hypothetical protein